MSRGKHWDYVLTCFESVGAVSGGIGTYTRLLLEEFGRPSLGHGQRSVLLLNSARHAAERLDWLPPNVTVRSIPEAASIGGSQLNNLVDLYRQFSFNAMTELRALQERGDTFGYVEVPDFSAEGYYLLKARRYGLLRIDRVGVRLHSPLLMLHEDNDSRAEATSQAFRFYDEERTVYRLADDVLYGGDAMLQRVLALLPPELARQVRLKAVKIPHPWPPPRHLGRPLEQRSRARPKDIGYVGRLEWRKGVDLLVKAAVRLLEERPGAARFHFFGRDTQTFRGRSIRAYLDKLIPPHLVEHFVFHDYVPQQELWSKHLPAMDGFVFPSRFENYPNVLLEVLELGRPVLVSSSGCMPEMAARFPTVTAYEPSDCAELARLLSSRVIDGSGPTDVRELYKQQREEMHARIVDGYSSLVRARPVITEAARADGLLSIAFIVAHYQQSAWLGSLLGSIESQRRPGDEVIVVDDCSSPEEADGALETVRAFGARYLTTPRNGGPSVSRNLGAAASKAELLYFVDADDELQPESVDLLRRVMAEHGDIDVTTGFFQAFGDEHHAWAAYDPTVPTILTENASHCGILIRRAVFEGVGGYQERQRLHFEDWELNMRLALSGARFEVVPVISYRYRVRKSAGRNSTHPEFFQSSYEGCLRRALGAFEAQVDPRVRELLVARLVGPEREAPKEPPVLRHRIADRVNGLLKRTPLHSTLKHVLEVLDS